MQAGNRAETTQTADNLTDNFASVIHEMRTPLTAMKASLALLATEHAEQAEQRVEVKNELFAICRRNTDYLLNLVNDLLELSRIDATPARRAEPVPLAEVTNETLASLAALAAQQRSLITGSVPPHLTVAAEPDGVRRILLNIVGNAIKFAPGGHIEVSADRRGNMIRLRISDDGPGMSRHQVETLFSRYTNIRRSAIQDGTGLGMAITKALVERYQGRIHVESEMGRGTCFTVELRTYRKPETFPATIRRADPDVKRYVAEIING